MLVRDLPFSQWQKSRHSFNHQWQRILVIVYFCSSTSVNFVITHRKDFLLDIEYHCSQGMTREFHDCANQYGFELVASRSL